tara:strand:- start:432 stop:707 length:276 start_codon:yes stop_codon:yes gene_type:complete
MALTKIPSSLLDKSSNVDFADNERLRIGTDNDLQIYHSGSESRIDENGAGDIKPQTVSLLNKDMIIHILKGMQELKAENETLKARIETLEE